MKYSRNSRNQIIDIPHKGLYLSDVFPWFSSFKRFVMPVNNINGIRLYWEITGNSGEPLVLVHGSWGDHHNWDQVSGELSKTFRVLTYDRRGHSQSERPSYQGSMEEDVTDLAAMIEFHQLAPAHILGNSGGAAVALKTAAKHPALFRTLVVHEPSLFGILQSVPEAQPYLREVNQRISAVMTLLEKNENEAAAKLFVETIAFGPGAWDKLPPNVQQTFIFNAPTFLDENRDPGCLQMNVDLLAAFDKPTLLTQGTLSPPFFPMVLDQLAKVLPQATRKILEGAGHVPHMSHSAEYIQLIKAFCSSNGLAS